MSMKILSLILLSTIILSSCRTTSIPERKTTKEDKLERSDIYIPWWAK